MLNGQQARKYRHELSNKHRWWIWYQWRGESQWKRSGSGNWEAGACTFETRTVI